MSEDAPRRYVIVPYEKAGPVSFGMTKAEVERAMGMSPQTVERFKGKVDDMFPDFYVYYDDQDVCEAVEFFEGCAVMLDGIDLFSLPYPAMRERLAAMDPDLEAGNDGCTSYKLGIGLYNPFAKDPTAIEIESVIAFRKGYYGEGEAQSQ